MHVCRGTILSKGHADFEILIRVDGTAVIDVRHDPRGRSEIGQVDINHWVGCGFKSIVHGIEGDELLICFHAKGWIVQHIVKDFVLDDGIANGANVRFRHVKDLVVDGHGDSLNVVFLKDEGIRLFFIRIISSGNILG